jgi:hypothetical protein
MIFLLNTSNESDGLAGDSSAKNLAPADLLVEEGGCGGSADEDEDE